MDPHVLDAVYDKQIVNIRCWLIDFSIERNEAY